VSALPPPAGGRVLLIHAEGTTFTNPSLDALIAALTENGIACDLRTPAGTPPPPRSAVVWLPVRPVLRRIKSVVTNRLSSRAGTAVVARLEHAFVYRRAYDLIIGVDRRGIIEAREVARLVGCAYAYFSFEIMFAAETSARFKRPEQVASRGACLWVVQDAERGRELARENGLSEDRRMLLPLAARGPAAPAVDRLRDRLGVPPERRVAISIGSLEGWTLAADLLVAVAHWPAEWVLIVHERFGRARELVLQHAPAAAPLIGERIFLSEQPTPAVGGMESVLAGVDCGVALYRPDFTGPFTGLNLVHLGYASGKVATYLRHGVPVLMNGIGALAADARAYDFGLVVDSPAEIGVALSRLHGGMRANAIEFFARRLDFRNHEAELLARLRRCMRAAPCTA
jgi:hypothetical protein